MALLDVKTELLRYESEHGKLPGALADLVPNYLRVDDITGPNGPLYRYDPAKRIVAQTEGTLIRGLYSRRSKPEKLELGAAPVHATAPLTVATEKSSPVHTTELPPDTHSTPSTQQNAGRIALDRENARG